MAGDITRQAVIAAWLCIPIAPAAADTVTLRYGQIPSTVRSVSAVYLSIAQQKGFFAREGASSSTRSDRGRHRRYDFDLHAQALALKRLGEADYSVKELVGTPVRFDCLNAGECDAVPLGQPEDFVAMGEGYRRFGVSTEAVAAFQFQVIAARRAWAQANKDAVVRFVRALAAAFRFIRDPANREEVATAIVKLTGSSDQIARQTLALYFEPERGVLPKQAEIDLNGLTQVIAFMGEGGAIKPPLPQPERFVDLQYLRAAGVQ